MLLFQELVCNLTHPTLSGKSNRGVGTGGTISGCGNYLKTMDPNVQVILADPEGSGLFNKVKYGVMYDKKESEGTKRRHQVCTSVLLLVASLLTIT